MARAAGDHPVRFEGLPYIFYFQTLPDGFSDHYYYSEKDAHYFQVLPNIRKAQKYLPPPFSSKIVFAILLARCLDTKTYLEIATLGAALARYHGRPKFHEVFWLFVPYSLAHELNGDLKYEVQSRLRD